MIAFTFYTVAERQPKHGDWIIYLDRHYAWDQTTFEPKEGEVDYCWFEKEDGSDTGTQIMYDPENPEVPEGCVLEMMIHGCVLSPQTLWCYPEEMEAVLGTFLEESRL